jgi:phosphoglycolate phosphatase-like HAD superfamily hydrolase
MTKDHSGQQAQAGVLVREGFAWNRQDAYLFDIDGTLLRSRDRIHFHAFAESVHQVTGLRVSLEGVSLHGGTDTAILREAFELAGIAPAAWEPQREEILAAMRAIVAGRRAEMDLWTMPGVREMLTYLAARGALLGLATGNLEEIGWIKVEETGLREWFRFGGFSDRFELRPEMVRDAARQARALAGDGATVCVVGDTPRDITAAHANDLPVIAVATGNYSWEQLAALEPEVCAVSLAALLETVPASSRSFAPEPETSAEVAR